jgi:hypothetical protein
MGSSTGGGLPGASAPRRKQRSPWALDEERAELGKRIQGYARDHRCSYTPAFPAIELAHRLGEP